VATARRRWERNYHGSESESRGYCKVFPGGPVVSRTQRKPSDTRAAIIVGMMKIVLSQCSGLLLVGLVICSALGKKAPASPPAETSVIIGGKQIAIKYAAPSMRGRKIFGGLEPYGKVWRAGANAATALHTDADL